MFEDTLAGNETTSQDALPIPGTEEPEEPDDKPHKGSSSSNSMGPDTSYGQDGILTVGTTTVPPVTPSVASVVSDTTIDFTVKRGAAYCFKMTVQNGTGVVPSFTVGNGNVLKTQFVAQIGNDYYFRIFAIGNPGDRTGVYTALPGQTAVKHCTVTIG